MNKERRIHKVERRLNGPDRKQSGSLPIDVFNKLADLHGSDLPEEEKEAKRQELEPKLAGFDPIRLNELSRKYADAN